MFHYVSKSPFPSCHKISALFLTRCRISPSLSSSSHPQSLKFFKVSTHLISTPPVGNFHTVSNPHRLSEFQNLRAHSFLHGMRPGKILSSLPSYIGRGNWKNVKLFLHNYILFILVGSEIYKNYIRRCETYL